MPRFVPMGQVLQLPSLLDGGGNPKPSETPRKIVEADPMRRLLYVENVGGDADPVQLAGSLTPKLGSGDDTLGLPSDSFAFAREQNPLVLAYAGVVAGLQNALPIRNNEGYYFAELLDDVPALGGVGTWEFHTVTYTGARLVAQPGPLYQPIKVWEAQAGTRFLRLVATGGQIVLTTGGAPIAVSQGFELPLFFPLTFRWPYVPSRSLFAFDASGASGRLNVSAGYA